MPNINVIILPSAFKDPVVARSICHTEGIVINAHQQSTVISSLFLKAVINCGGKTSDKWRTLEKLSNISLMSSLN